jgi:NhaP-type Na+/H+ or K+/H+ antiporter
MTTNEITIGLASIVVVGVAAQWVGRRFEFPAILLLLPAGLVAGETGLVEPAELFGDTLFPLVTLLVALLLFQAALQLRFADLPPAARAPVLRLVTIGGTITFLGAALAVAAFVDVDGQTAWLIGAVLVVSGPTVVGPIVRAVRPASPVGSVLNWESTILDPLGAVLGAVVLNLVVASARGALHPALQIGARLGIGVVVGLVAAALLVAALARFLVTDDMEAAVSLLFAVAAFAVAEVLASESGLLAAVTLGVVVANQRYVPTARITGFGETLEVLIVGTLFMVLGALVPLGDLWEDAWAVVGVVAALVLVVRPLAATVALFRTRLPVRQRVLIGAMDPRGIVAAATATQFAGVLADDGLPSDHVVSVVFGVILGTCVLYGLTARPVARALGLVEPRRSGVALVGDAPWIDDLGAHLRRIGVPVVHFVATPSADDSQTVSVHASHHVVDGAVAHGSLAMAIVAAPLDAAVLLLEARLVEEVGRRHVVRLGGRRATPLGAVRVERCTGPPARGAVALVVVRPDASVHTGRRRPGRADTVLALVGDHGAVG